MKNVIAIIVALVAWTAPVAAQEQGQKGRYTIIAGPIGGADVFLLDTQDGRVWRHVQISGTDVWQFMYRLDNQADTKNFVDDVLPNIAKGNSETKATKPAPNGE
jgi:hypothetical protein